LLVDDFKVEVDELYVRAASLGNPRALLSLSEKAQTAQDYLSLVTKATVGGSMIACQRLKQYYSGENYMARRFKDSPEPNPALALQWEIVYTPGRPNSGGFQLKLKFTESASFIVSQINAKRSVELMLLKNGILVPAGNVTIPANHDIPPIGAVVECRYLYAFPESGVIYQPVYLGRREDIRPEECTVSQLKFKQASAVA